MKEYDPIRSQKNISLTIYTLSHFVVDFSCFIFLWGAFAARFDSPGKLGAGFLLYNVLAFGLQPFLGYASDIKRNFRPALWGFLFLAGGLSLSFAAWPALVLCALGNACFHVGGGEDCLRRGEGKMGGSGVFVSSGALGVALGTYCGAMGLISPAVAALPVLLCGFAALRFCPPCEGDGAVGDYIHLMKSGASGGVLAGLLLFSIVIRAYGGAVVPMAWKTGVFLSFLPAVCAFLGKALGGVLADRLGARRVGTVSLLCAIPLLCFFSWNPWLCGLGLLCFNMTMPITLCALAGLFPKFPGFAFGLTTLALLAGSFPVFVITLSGAAALWTVGILTGTSAVCMLYCMNNRGKRKEKLQ